MEENVTQINVGIMINVDLSLFIFLITELYDEKKKTVLANFNEKRITCRTQNFYILLTFLLITIALLIAVSN